MPSVRRIRRSSRLQGFDYHEAGAYFVTVVTVGRMCVLGEVVRDAVHLNRAGAIAARAWREIPRHFPNARSDAFVVMPNHIHGILLLADVVGAKHASPLRVEARGTQPGSVSAVIQAFKSASTRRVNLVRGTLGASLWQRGFIDHVLRDEEDLGRIRAYIATNPLRWALDRENPSRRAP